MRWFRLGFQSLLKVKNKTVKAAPDATVYRTADGTRVRITRAKQFPVRGDDPAWLQGIHAKANEAEQVVRVSDGHALWGFTRKDLTPE